MLAHIALTAALAATAIAAPVEEPDARPAPPPDAVYIIPGLVSDLEPNPLSVGVTRNWHAHFPNGLALTVSTGGKHFNNYWTYSPWPIGHGELKLVNTNKCIDAGPNPAEGVKLGVADCQDVPQQRWKVYYQNEHKIELEGYNLCWDLTDGKGHDGHVVQLSACSDGDPNQVFSTKSIFA